MACNDVATPKVYLNSVNDLTVRHSAKWWLHPSKGHQFLCYFLLHKAAVIIVCLNFRIYFHFILYAVAEDDVVAVY